MLIALELFGPSAQGNLSLKKKSVQGVMKLFFKNRHLNLRSFFIQLRFLEFCLQENIGIQLHLRTYCMTNNGRKGHFEQRYI